MIRLDDAMESDIVIATFVSAERSTKRRKSPSAELSLELQGRAAATARSPRRQGRIRVASRLRFAQPLTAGPLPRLTATTSGGPSPAAASGPSNSALSRRNGPHHRHQPAAFVCSDLREQV